MSQRRDRQENQHSAQEVGAAIPLNTAAAAAAAAASTADDSVPSKKTVTITFVTGNAGKLSEVNAMLTKRENDHHHHQNNNNNNNNKHKKPLHAVTLVNQSVDLPELQGQPEEIAIEKAKTAFKLLGNKPCMVEDTSLCFNALGGGKLPGPYIRDFLTHLGHDGLNKILVGFDDTRAYAQCIFAVAISEDDVRLFVGRCYGNIVPKRGDTGFGWDPVFQPTKGGVEGAEPGMNTFAEMSKDEKNEISHRRRALDKLVDFFDTL